MAERILGRRSSIESAARNRRSSNIFGGGTAESTSEFFTGGSALGAVIFPTVPFLEIGGGVNHLHGVSTSVEYGIGMPGAGISPAGYGFEVKK